MTLIVACLMLFCMPLHNAKAVESSKESDYNHQKLDSFINRERELNRIPGLSIAITDEKGILYQYNHGTRSDDTPINHDTPFLLASATKPISAMLLLNLLETKGIPTDTNIGMYLPFPKNADISFNDILQHTSGIPAGAYNLKEQTLAAVVTDIAKANRGDKQYEYSSANYQLVGAAIEAISGEPYEQYAQKTLRQPLGMSNTFTARKQNIGPKALGHQYWFGLPYESNLTYPTSGIANGFTFSSASDMSKLLQMQLVNGASPSGEILLSKSVITKLSENGVTVPEETYKMASGWRDGSISGHRALFHGGQWVDGLTELAILPEKGIGIVVLSNAAFMFEPDATERMLEGIAAIIASDTIPETKSGKLTIISNIFIVIAIMLLVTTVSKIKNTYYFIRRKKYVGMSNRSVFISFGKNVAIAGIIIGVLSLLGIPISRVGLALPDIAAILIVLLTVEILSAIVKASYVVYSNGLHKRDFK